jgi:hypothetical protein
MGACVTGMVCEIAGISGILILVYLYIILQICVFRTMQEGQLVDRGTSSPSTHLELHVKWVVQGSDLSGCVAGVQGALLLLGTRVQWQAVRQQTQAVVSLGITIHDHDGS